MSVQEPTRGAGAGAAGVVPAAWPLGACPGSRQGPRNDTLLKRPDEGKVGQNSAKARWAGAFAEG
jgi:hypothetical protein